MAALLLTLHLWQVPVLPPYAAQLGLGAVPRLNLLTAEAEALPGPVADPGLTDPAVTPITRLLGEAGGAAAAYLIGQVLVAAAELGLAVGANGYASSNQGTTAISVAAGVLGFADLAAGPLLFTWGARVAAGWLGERTPEVGLSVAGAYLGAGIGMTAWAVLVACVAFANPSSSSGSLSPLALVAIIASVLLPLGGGVGASVGLHLRDDEVASPPPAVSVPPIVLPPDSLPPPQARSAVITIPFG